MRILLININRNKMTYQIVNDRVLIQKNENTKKTSSGLIIAADASEKTVTGKVLAVGNGKPLENGTVRPMTVKEGDTVMFPKNAGIEIKFNGDDCLVLKEDEIILIM